MADPFATALGALLTAPGSVAAIYTSLSSGTSVAIRVIRHQPSEVVHFSVGRAVADGSSFIIRRSDAPDCAHGDLLEIDGDVLTILADPLLDAEGVSWTAQAA